MTKLQVKSSTIKTVQYCYEKGILEVEFIRGAIYRYFDVPVHTVCQLLFQAESVGSYFNQNIAKNFEYEKVEDK